MHPTGGFEVVGWQGEKDMTKKGGQVGSTPHPGCQWQI